MVGGVGEFNTRASNYENGTFPIKYLVPSHNPTCPTQDLNPGHPHTKRASNPLDHPPLPTGPPTQVTLVPFAFAKNNDSLEGLVEFETVATFHILLTLKIFYDVLGI